MNRFELMIKCTGSAGIRLGFIFIIQYDFAYCVILFEGTLIIIIKLH